MAVNTTASPSLRATPGGNLDPTRQAEYPIRLGDKLARKEGAKDGRFVALRYNYRPKHTLNQRSKIIAAPSSATTLKLTLEDTPNDTSAPITYTYSGSVDPKSKSSEKLSTIALIFDSSRGEFVAEPVTSELNFNITSGPGQKARSHGRLDTLDDHNHNLDSGSERDEDDLFGGNGNLSDAEPPDKDNPFHYRHFLDLDQTQTNKETATTNAAMTPSMTPNSDFGEASSPVPAPRKSGLAAAKPKPKANALSHAPVKPATAAPSNTKQKPPRFHPATKPAPKKSRPAASSSSLSPSPPPHGSAPADRSPNIVVSPAPGPKTTNTSADAIADIDDDLVIDMGSPPLVPRRLHELDPSAFASAPHSPDIRVSQRPALDDDLDADADADGDADSDVEPLMLGSPTAPPTSITATGTSGAVVGLGVSTIGDDSQEMGHADAEDEVDEEIMKDMEDILEQEVNDEEEDYEMEAAAPAMMEEEESEVSEEE